MFNVTINDISVIYVIASVRCHRTLISILTFVSCVRGLLIPASLNMRARATLRGVVLILRISAYKNVRALIDISKPPDEWYIPSHAVFSVLKLCRIRGKLPPIAL